jgi:RNA polymerase sigma factor (sigma-70 family)
MLPRKRIAVHGTLPDGDAALVDGVRRGVLATFEQIFRAHWDPLCRYAFYHLRSADDAEEVVQRVFARIWQNRGEWSVRGSLRDYLFLATRNASFDHLSHLSVARRWRERRVAEIVNGSSGSHPQADAFVLAQAWRKLLATLDAGTEEVATAMACSVHRGPPEHSERRVADVVRFEVERRRIWYAGAAALLLAASLPWW